MRKLFACLALAMLAGCAGLDVTWQLQASYISDDLMAKRKAAEQNQLDTTTARQLP